jgi:hypothetical protein
MAATNYRELELDQIQKTLRTLQRRIDERFPDSGLSRVADQLCRVADDTGPVVERARRPNWLVRTAVGVTIVLIVALAGGLLIFLASTATADVGGIGDALQAVESAAQDVIFLAIAIYFMFTIEGRLKRRVALRELHRLRSIVHIVDMHQLTKDPDNLLAPGMSTASSPERMLTRFQLSRSLDYCTELLSLSSKVAALHVQYLNDPVVLDAVNDIEVLAANLSNKMWQKIVILGTAPPFKLHGAGAEST